MALRRVDHAEAISLHRDRNWAVARIALYFGVQPPAIYRAFKRGGYVFKSLYHLRPQKKARVAALPLPPMPPSPGKRPYPPVRKTYLTGAALFDSAPPPIAARDPCPRCGVRGDLGCKHSGMPRMGWHAG